MGQDLKLEQIQEVVSSNPEFKKQLLSSLQNDFINEAKTSGLIIRTKEEHDEFLNNYKSNVLTSEVQKEVDAKIGEKIKEVHSRYDEDLFEILGKRKRPDQKTYEFLKEELGALKNAQGKGNDPVLADRIKQLENIVKEKENYVPKDEIEQIKKSYEAKLFDISLTSNLDKYALAVPAHITDDKAKQQFVAMQKELIKKDIATRFEAKQDAEGNTAFYLNGELVIDTHTAKPMSLDQIIANYYSSYIMPTKPTVTGAGGGAGAGAVNDPSEAALKSKADVQEYLLKKGFITGSVDFNKEYKRILTQYAITQ